MPSSLRRPRKRPPFWFAVAIWGGVAGAAGAIGAALALSAG